VIWPKVFSNDKRRLVCGNRLPGSPQAQAAFAALQRTMARLPFLCAAAGGIVSVAGWLRVKKEA